MEERRYVFIQCDSGGRIIEKTAVYANSYEEAYTKVEKRAIEINSHGFTLCCL